MKSTFFGLQKYSQSMQTQAHACQLVSSSGFPVVLGFEYYPVITFGKRAQIVDEINATEAELVARGFDLIETDRGGQATLHSPGQLVIYPIVPIRKLNIGVKDYVALLESATILWLERYGIKAKRSEDAGVFTDKGKLAFIGIRVENGITRHGISINIANDLSLFGGIRSCGVQQRKLDSLLENQVSLGLEEAFNTWILYFTHELMSMLPASNSIS